jgi:hypothetical protein
MRLDSEENSEATVEKIDFKNPPLCVGVYEDPDTNLEKVLVIINMFSGIKNLKFELSDDGMSLCVVYDWPEAIYNVGELFKKKDGTAECPNFHPKYKAVEKIVKTSKISVEDKPHGKIKVALPIKVQNIPATWSKKLVKRSDEAIVAIIELSGFPKKYEVKESDTSIILE